MRCELFTVPQLVIVAKNKSIFWYGDPATNAVEVRWLQIIWRNKLHAANIRSTQRISSDQHS